MEGWGALEMCLNYSVWILCLKTICGGVKTKTFHRNLPISEGDSKPYPEFVSVCACVRWVVVYSQLSAPQGHHTNRDSWGLGSITSRHTDCTPWPLKSRHFRTAVHCSLSLISSASSSGRKSGSDPGFQQKAVPFPGIPRTKHTCTQMPVIFPFHKHLSNDERGDAFKPKTLFSHSCRRIKRRQEANGRWKEWVKN